MLDETQVPKRSFAATVQTFKERPTLSIASDEEFSWYTTSFHIWPGEHCPALRRQSDMGLAIRTIDDDLEESRTSTAS
jgi:hypothetical protein